MEQKIDNLAVAMIVLDIIGVFAIRHSQIDKEFQQPLTKAIDRSAVKETIKLPHANQIVN